MRVRIDTLSGIGDNLNNAILDLNASRTNQAIRIAELETRTDKDHSNSSKSLLSNEYRKSVQNNHKKSGRTAGGKSASTTIKEVMVHQGCNLLYVFQG